MPTWGYVPVDANNAQKKLSLRATREPDHRFADLYGLLYNPEWLETARRHVSRVSGGLKLLSEGRAKPVRLLFSVFFLKS
jgi:hypothetical protein